MDLLTPDEILRLTPAERLALIAQRRDSLEHEQLPLSNEQESTPLADEDRRNAVKAARGS